MYTFQELTQLKGETYRELAGRKTFRFEKNGKGYFAKLHWGVGWKEIFKNLLYGRLPVLGAKNEWLAIQRLEQLKIPTMKLISYGCEGWNPAHLKSFLITEELAPIISLEDLCQTWPQTPPPFSIKKNLIQQIAHIARTLHENGVNHRDFYICHFLLDTSRGLKNLDANHLSLYLIDLHRVQLRQRTPQRWRIKDISGLYFSCMNIGLTQRDVLRFIKDYDGRSLREILQTKKSFLRRVQKRAIKLYYKTFKKLPPINTFPTNGE
jgi:heptose I phosphotransferase